jgi:hypothetical protein
MGNTNLKEFFDLDHWKLPYEMHTPKMSQNVASWRHSVLKTVRVGFTEHLKMTRDRFKSVENG